MGSVSVCFVCAHSLRALISRRALALVATSPQQSSTPGEAKPNAPSFGVRLVAVGHRIPPLAASPLARLERELSHMASVMVSNLLTSSTVAAPLPSTAADAPNAASADTKVKPEVAALLKDRLFKRGLSDSLASASESARQFLAGVVAGGDGGVEVGDEDDATNANKRSGARFAAWLEAKAAAGPGEAMGAASAAASTRPSKQLLGRKKGSLLAVSLEEEIDADDSLASPKAASVAAGTVGAAAVSTGTS